MSTRRTEAGLCNEFRDQLEPGWIVYPETCGWDMLLVLTEPQELTPRQRLIRGRRVATQRLGAGTQVGIEAKLRANSTVPRQALPDNDWRDVEQQCGPDYRAVLLPKAGADFRLVAGRLDIIVLTPEESYLGPVAGRLESVLWRSNAWPHDSREPVPDVVPDVPAGVPCPVKLTRWKLGAIKLSIRLRAKGFLVRADFKEFGVNPGTWYHRWLQADGKDPRSRGLKWVAAPDFTPFDEQHPGVVAQLEAQGLVDKIRGVDSLPGSVAS
jgi:hypothetical protein